MPLHDIKLDPEQIAGFCRRHFRKLDVLQESIDFLRLSIKYILFDLEATRRENQYLRKMLEETDAS